MTPEPKQRIPFFQLVRAAERAGARDAKLVASCISIGANANGIEQTIALWQEKRPDFFTVVDFAHGAGASSG